MTTARNIINSIMRKIQVLGSGSTLTSAEAQDALELVNDMIASWSTQGALIYTEEIETFNLTGALSHTIGSGGVFDTEIPKRITAAYVTYQGTDYPLTLIDGEQYADIADKGLTGTPDRLYFNGDYPLAKIFVYPVQSGATLTIHSEKPLTGFSSLDTVFSMPAEYRRAITNNGAVEIAPEYETEASPTIKRIAKQSLDLIKAQNKKNNSAVMKIDRMFLQRANYDIYRGH